MNKEHDCLKNYKIGVLAGGPSSEREISLKSGQAVFECLRKRGLNVVFIDVREEDFYDQMTKEDIGVAFIALHGRFGEDGKVQKLLEQRGISYTGSGPEASRFAIDKILSKEKLIAQGINVPGYYISRKGEQVSSLRGDYPLVVKPRFEGSSIGLSIVGKAEDMPEALKEAHKFSEDVLVEEFISGREITVGVLAEEALSVVEIKTKDGVYDFNAKYNSKETKYIAPAQLDEDVASRAKKIALSAHLALGCKDFSRVDMMLSRDNNIFVLEVNTVPGLTERSLLPMAAEASGISFEELCTCMLYGSIAQKTKCV